MENEFKDEFRDLKKFKEKFNGAERLNLNHSEFKYVEVEPET